MKNIIKNNLFLFSYVKRYAKAYILLIPISAIFQAVSVILNVLGIKYIIEALEDRRIEKSIIIILIYFTISIIVKAYFQWTNYYFPLLAKKISIGMSTERMNVSENLDYQCFDIPEYYDRYSRALKSGEQQVSTLVGSLIALISNIVTLISVILVISNYSIVFVLFAICDTLFSYFIIIRQNKLEYKFDFENTRLMRQENYYKNTCLQPNVQLENRLFGVVKFFVKKFIEISDLIFNKYKKHLKKFNSYAMLQVIVSSILTMLTIFLSTYLVYTNQLSLGGFTSVVTGISSLTSQLLSLVDQFPKFIQNSRYAEDYRKIVEYKPTIELKQKNITTKLEITNIEFQHVFFKYPSTDEYVLNDLSFKISIKDRVALVGKNGAGKTTIIKLLLRLYDPTKGIILINGVNIKTLPVESIRDAFSAIFQDYNVYPISINDNICFGQTKSCGNLIEDVGLWTKVKGTNLQKSATRMFEDDGIVFSGGESQK